MLTGPNPLRMPAYTGAMPTVVTLICTCRRRHVVLTGVADAELVRAAAEARGAVYVDARRVPFMNCECGEALDFTMGETAETVM